MHGDRTPIDRARPQRIAGLPARYEQAWLLAVGADEADRDRLALSRDVERNLAVAEPDRAQALARDHAPRSLARNPALPFTEHVIDRGRDRGQDARGLRVRHLPVKAVGELLGQERGRELARPPALVLHQRRQEGNVVADAPQPESREPTGPARGPCRR